MIFFEKLEEEINNYKSEIRSKEILSIANKSKKYLGTNEENIEIINILIKKGGIYFSIATLLFKEKKDLLDKKYEKYIINWIKNNVNSWGRCDQLCYRVINPYLEKYNDFYKELIKFSNSKDKNIRRVSLVALIRTGNSLKVYTPWKWVVERVEALIDDKELHIQKAIGWVLKCSYYNYPQELEKYLRKNIYRLSRTSFRYALENMPNDLKEELMGLTYKK